ncbi:DUF5776 domain-containing protein [Levilactobacillus spicheri]|uniref:Extracellular matrix-binding protein ebh GA module domain-containing protein n=1 Tax=Levilactobacillus spicheri TaxID=216463 RepID=A0ABQ0WQS9_9LACO|nr:DUF5776 domain-containing protein [Levilactobacillus spicheri]GEO67411.1 hypothetical protein LSP04_18300 [Levilactobacillus spicheri]
MEQSTWSRLGIVLFSAGILLGMSEAQPQRVRAADLPLSSESPQSSATVKQLAPAGRTVTRNAEVVASPKKDAAVETGSRVQPAGKLEIKPQSGPVNQKQVPRVSNQQAVKVVGTVSKPVTDVEPQETLTDARTRAENQIRSMQSFHTLNPTAGDSDREELISRIDTDTSVDEVNADLQVVVDQDIKNNKIIEERAKAKTVVDALENVPGNSLSLSGADTSISSARDRKTIMTWINLEQETVGIKQSKLFFEDAIGDFQNLTAADKTNFKNKIDKINPVVHPDNSLSPNDLDQSRTAKDGPDGRDIRIANIWREALSLDEERAQGLELVEKATNQSPADKQKIKDNITKGDLETVNNIIHQEKMADVEPIKRDVQAKVQKLTHLSPDHQKKYQSVIQGSTDGKKILSQVAAAQQDNLTDGKSTEQTALGKLDDKGTITESIKNAKNEQDLQKIDQQIQLAQVKQQISADAAQVKPSPDSQWLNGLKRVGTVEQAWTTWQNYLNQQLATQEKQAEAAIKKLSHLDAAGEQSQKGYITELSKNTSLPTDSLAKDSLQDYQTKQTTIKHVQAQAQLQDAANGAIEQLSQLKNIDTSKDIQKIRSVVKQNKANDNQLDTINKTVADAKKADNEALTTCRSNSTTNLQSLTDLTDEQRTAVKKTIDDQSATIQSIKEALTQATSENNETQNKQNNLLKELPTLKYLTADEQQTLKDEIQQIKEISALNKLEKKGEQQNLADAQTSLKVAVDQLADLSASHRKIAESTIQQATNVSEAEKARENAIDQNKTDLVALQDGIQALPALTAKEKADSVQRLDGDKTPADVQKTLQKAQNLNQLELNRNNAIQQLGQLPDLSGTDRQNLKTAMQTASQSDLNQLAKQAQWENQQDRVLTNLKRLPDLSEADRRALTNGVKTATSENAGSLTTIWKQAQQDQNAAVAKAQGQAIRQTNQLGALSTSEKATIQHKIQQGTTVAQADSDYRKAQAEAQTHLQQVNQAIQDAQALPNLDDEEQVSQQALLLVTPTQGLPDQVAAAQRQDRQNLVTTQTATTQAIQQLDSLTTAQKHQLLARVSQLTTVAQLQQLQQAARDQAARDVVVTESADQVVAPTSTTSSQFAESTQVPFKVYLTQALWRYRSLTFSPDNRIRFYPSRPRTQAAVFTVVAVFNGPQGTRFYRLRDGSYITATAGYTAHLYYQMFPLTGKLKLLHGIYAYRHAHFRQSDRRHHFHRGQVVTIRRLIRRQDGVNRYQLSDGTYITANKQFVDWQ